MIFNQTVLRGNIPFIHIKVRWISSAPSLYGAPIQINPIRDGLTVLEHLPLNLILVNEVSQCLVALFFAFECQHNHVVDKEGDDAPIMLLNVISIRVFVSVQFHPVCIDVSYLLSSHHRLVKLVEAQRDKNECVWHLFWVVVQVSE